MISFLKDLNIKLLRVCEQVLILNTGFYSAYRYLQGSRSEQAFPRTRSELIYNSAAV